MREGTQQDVNSVMKCSVAANDHGPWNQNPSLERSAATHQTDTGMTPHPDDAGVRGQYDGMCMYFMAAAKQRLLSAG
jgi:hypothetical protein